MARSDGSATQRGVQLPDGGYAIGDDPRGRLNDGLARWQSQFPQQAPGHGQPGFAPAPGQPQQGGYHPHGQAQFEPHATHAAPAAGGQGNFAPHDLYPRDGVGAGYRAHDPGQGPQYARPSPSWPEAAQPPQEGLADYRQPGFDPRYQAHAGYRQDDVPAAHGGYQDHGQGYAAPDHAHTAQPFGGHAALPQEAQHQRWAAGYDGHAVPPQQQEYTADPRSWDLSHYGQNQSPHGYPAEPLANPAGQHWQHPVPHGYQQPDPRWPQEQGWQVPAGDAYGAGQQPYDPRYAADPNAYGYPAGAQPLAHDGYQQAVEGHDGPEELPAEPSRGPRPMVVVAALVGAIALGGGLAFAYKHLGGGRSGGKPPVVKADVAPAKSKPADPGGKAVAHTDKVFVNRLADGKEAKPPTPAAVPPPPAEADGGSRKVTTLIVNRDGSIVPQMTQPAPAAPPPPLPAPASVPGMVIEGLTPRPVASAPPPPPPQLRPSAAATVVAPSPRASAPQVADLPLPKVRERAEPVPRKRAAERDDAKATRTAAAAPAATASAGAGFVAVLASKKSRDDALKVFADLHQKYPDALQGRTPDVRQVNLGEKGVWYRLIVGPPGSREAAANVCKQLKSQGFSGCWATGY